MTTISLDVAVSAVISGADEAMPRHWAVLEQQFMEHHGDRAAAREAASERMERCRKAMALLREQRVSQGDNVKPLSELRPNGATLWQWVHLAEVNQRDQATAGFIRVRSHRKPNKFSTGGAFV